MRRTLQIIELAIFNRPEKERRYHKGDNNGQGDEQKQYFQWINEVMGRPLFWHNQAGFAGNSFSTVLILNG